MHTHKLLVCFSLLFATACTDAPADSARDRGPIGKADLVGSCEEACDGPSLDGNCWCDDLCESYGDCCEDKVDVCEEESSYVSFKLFRGGFCPSEMDCSASIELLADGTLLVDRMGEPGEDHIATVSAEDLANAIAVLTDPALLAILDGGDTACSQPTDIFESMTLVDGAGDHRTSTTFCQGDALNAARKVLEDLRDTYLPAQSFESFRLFRGGFCPPEIDCTGSIELSADGTLRVDRMGELEGAVHEAVVDADDLAAAIEVLTAAALVELLDGDAACVQPTDIFESMTLKDARGEHHAPVTFCDQAAIQAARTALNELASSYLP